MNRLLLCLLLSGCATTWQFKARREATSIYRSCVDMHGKTAKRSCLIDNAEWCKAHGLESGCGTDDLFIGWPR